MVLQHAGEEKEKKVTLCVFFLVTPWLQLLDSSTNFVCDVLQLFFQQRDVVFEGVPLLLQVLQVRLETRTLAFHSLESLVQRPDLRGSKQKQ